MLGDGPFIKKSEAKDRRMRSGIRQSPADETVLVSGGQSRFFQAEDGIRDRLVTEVQTCALPIFQHVERPARIAVGGAGDEIQCRRFRLQLRSEERRVGKECRSPRSPYHKKKKTLTPTKRSQGPSAAQTLLSLASARV